MQKFFIQALPPGETSVLLDDENLDHFRVLRLHNGDQVVLCDGEGTDYFCEIQDFQKRFCSLEVLSRAPSSGEPGVKVMVFMAAAKSDKLEHVIQKATELGADGITVFMSERCVSRLDGQTAAKKMTRWQKIAEAAAGQCGRGKIPGIYFLPDVPSVIKAAEEYQLPLLFYENEKQTGLSSALSGCIPRSAAIITGPEGGFTADEAMAFTSAGITSCTLGSRILRCETAPLCALSAIMYHCGEF